MFRFWAGLDMRKVYRLKEEGVPSAAPEGGSEPPTCHIIEH